MARKSKATLHPIVLALISVALLCLGWMMSFFPVFIFAALAPLMAITDQTLESKNPWNGLELIWIALSIGWLAGMKFDLGLIIPALVLGMVFTLPFAIYIWVHHTINSRWGKWIIVFGWLALEYVIIKSPWRDAALLLADSVRGQTTWMRWNSSIGYTAISTWILLANFSLYAALFRQTANVSWTIAFLVIVAAPILISITFITTEPVTRETMTKLYSGSTTATVYGDRGELIARSSAWLTLVVLLFTGVKYTTKRK